MEKRQNLKKMFPEMPEQMHETIIKTLANLEEENCAGATETDIQQERQRNLDCIKKPICIKRVAILAAALTVFMCMTVTATALFSWDERIIELFGNPSNEFREKMAAEGLISGQQAVASTQGITIAAVQSIQDETSIFIILDVVTEGVEISNIDFHDFRLLTENGVDICKEMKSGGIYFDVKEKEGGRPYEGTMMIRVDWTQETELSYKSLNLHFENLSYFQEAEHIHMLEVLEGIWDIPLTVSNVTDSTRICQINYPILIEEASVFQKQAVVVKEIALEPMSIRITLTELIDSDGIDMQNIDVVKISEDIGAVKEILYGVKYADGSRTQFSYRSLAISDDAIEAEVWSIIDVENVTAILLGANGELEITIE